MTEIKAIADLCPLDAGLGVYHARTIYRSYFPTSIWLDESCETISEERARDTSIQSFVGLTPNPSDQSMDIDLPKHWEGEIQVQISDIRGIVVRSLVTEQHKVTLSTSNMIDGVYFLRTSSQSGLMTFSTFIVQH